MFHTVEEVLRQKGSSVYMIAPGATALDAAARMNEHRIGSLVVVADGSVVGIVSERDILIRVVASQLPPAETPVSQIMTTPIITCSPATTLDELRGIMRTKRIRHVPVMENDRLAGMISIGDLNMAEAQSMSETIKYLEAYICSG